MNIKKTIIAASVALTLVAMVAPSFASADATSDLIAQLTATIATLTAKLNALTGGTTAPVTGNVPAECVGITFTRTLNVGLTGADVKCLQALLTSQGITQSVTGTFGPKTLANVKKFQTQKGITSSGNVGPLTRAALNGILTSGATTGNTGNTGNNNLPVVIPTGSGLTVMSSSDTPAAGTLVSGATHGQGGADLAHFTFVNGDNAPVKVTHLALNRIGVSQDSLLANVYLYWGATRLTDSAVVSSGVITFNDPNGLFTVPAGSSTTIRVLSDIAAALSGQTVGVSIISMSSVTTNASSVKGTFPVNSNIMTSASATLATVDFSSSTTPSTSGATATAVDPQNDYPVWQNIGTVGQRAVNLTRFSLYQTGSAPASAIQNYRLYIDGVQVGTAVTGPDANGYVTFDLSSSPAVLQTGARTFKVLADIIAGSSLTFSYSLRNSTDANFIDSQIAVGITPTYNSNATFAQLRSCQYGTSSPYSYGCSINSGSVTFAKTTDSPTGNIVLNAPNAVLARYTLTAAGEPVKITDLYAGVVDSTTAITYLANGALYANGVQIGSTTDLGAAQTLSGVGAGTHFSLGSSLVVNPGSPVTLEVRADIKEKSGTTALGSSDSLYAVVIAGSSNATGQVSKTTLSTPSANATGNTLSVSTGALSLTKYTAYTSQSLVATGQNQKLGEFTVSSNTTEPVNINTIVVDLTTITPGEVTSLYAVLGSTTLSTKSTTTATGNSWATNVTLPPGQSLDLSIYGTVASGYSNTSTVGVAADITGITASSATTVCAGNGGSTSGSSCSSVATLAGQALTYTSGSVQEDSSGTPLAGVVTGGTTVVAAKYNITATYDNFTVSEIAVSVPSGSDKVIQSAMLFDDATGLQIGNSKSSLDTTYTSDYYFTGLGLSVPRGTTKKVDVKFLLVTPDSTLGTDQLDIKASFDKIKYINGAGVQSSITSVTTANGNDIYVFKSLPTIALVPVTSSDQSSQGVNLASGSETTLYKWTIAAPTTGEIDVKQMKFDVTITAGSGNSNEKLSNFKLMRNGSQVTTVNIVRDADGVDLTNTMTLTKGTATVDVIFTTDEAIPAGQTYSYEMHATPANFVTVSTSGHDSASVKLDGNDTISATKLYDYAANATAPATTSNTGMIHSLSTASTGGAGSVTVGNTVGNNFIWSDHSASSGHSSATSGTTSGLTSSADWANSFGTYLNLPLASQGITTP